MNSHFHPSSHRIRSLAPVYFLLGLLLTCFLVGCFPTDGVDIVSETDERNYQRGKQLQREGRSAEALSAFLSVIEKRRGDAPESHLEAGELFRTKNKDPVSAIYHYRKYLEVSGRSEQAPHVRQLIDTATKDFAKSLPAQPMQGRYERLDLEEAVETLKIENQALKNQLANAQQAQSRAESPTRQQVSGTSATAAPRTPPARPAVSETAPAPSNRVYTVTSGDTLIHISGKVYGTGTRWKDIYEANRDVLPNENSLKIGMQLRIP